MKIHTVESLLPLIDSLRDDGKIVVHCHGCFDLLHYGHLKHFQAAKEHGDILIVSITGDKFVNKGIDRPAFPEHERAEMVAALECVDYVIINQASDSSDIILELMPDIYVKGIDYFGLPPDIEQLAVKRIGGKVVFTTTIKHSSSDLMERFFK